MKGEEILESSKYSISWKITLDEWQCRYTRGRRSRVCRTKRGKKIRVLWAISWYHRMYNFLDEVSHKPRSL